MRSLPSERGLAKSPPRRGRWIRCSIPILALALVACSDNNDPPDSGVTMDVEQPVDSGRVDTGNPADTGIVRVEHDAGPQLPCTASCDCAQGNACVDGVCQRLGTPVFCCEKSGCPRGQTCLNDQDQPDVCAGDPDPVDAGPAVDAGPGPVGAFCEEDLDCDQTLGLTCWTRDEPPFIWGYCTLENCTPACPAGSECIQFNGTPPTVGCMAACNVDADCRSDAYCLPIAGAPFFGVCIPDCRDDLFDCAPRDGTQYCSPTTGQCAPTPMQNPAGNVGDACINSTECGLGEICMGEIGWGFPGGMCSQVCSGLPEASPCGAGETCQQFAGIGLCFADCVGANCPNRANATCGQLDASWVTPSCVPQ